MIYEYTDMYLKYIGTGTLDISYDMYRYVFVNLVMLTIIFDSIIIDSMILYFV